MLLQNKIRYDNRFVGAGLAPALNKSNAQQQGDRKSRPYIWTPDESIASGLYLVKATTKDGLTTTRRVVYLR